MTAQVFVEQSSALPLVHMSVVSRNGAAYEPAELAGATRFTARLMRRTGGGMAAEELDEAFDRIGGSFGVDVGYNVTSFFGTTIRRSLDAFVETALKIVANPTFDAEARERLRRESAAEYTESSNDDATLARRWFRRRFYAGHPYGRSVIGTPTVFEAIDDAAIRRRYDAITAPDDLLFAFSGDISESQARSIATRFADALPQRSADARPEHAIWPGPKGRHLTFVDKPERTQTQILVGTHGADPHDADYPALHVANTVFGGTFTARLMREVRSKRGWSYGAYSSLPYARQRRALRLWTFPKAGDAADCIRLKLRLLREWVDEGVTAEELAWAKSYLIKSHAFAEDTASKRVWFPVDVELVGLPATFHTHYRQHVQSVTLEQANAAIRARIDPANLLVTVVGTEAEVGAAVRDAIEDLDSSEVVAHTDEC